ncbi:MAG TPA: response regulator [Bryobacteraceae bacterium]|nr:response regulator [Bryobacteraceae bacterium]
MAIILIADDEEPLRQLLYRFLQGHGYQVYTAADGSEALRIGRENLQDIDLLIADIRMPGVEGPEVARLLKATKADLKVLLISGYTEGKSVCEPFLPKPFAPAALLEKVRELLAPADAARPATP